MLVHHCHLSWDRVNILFLDLRSSQILRFFETELLSCRVFTEQVIPFKDCLRNTASSISDFTKPVQKTTGFWDETDLLRAGFRKIGFLCVVHQSFPRQDFRAVWSLYWFQKCIFDLGKKCTQSFSQKNQFWAKFFWLHFLLKSNVLFYAPFDIFTGKSFHFIEESKCIFDELNSLNCKQPLNMS